jgi:glyoxylase-like metal-dependent hydrolase (beta-lactamase superfamily II)
MSSFESLAELARVAPDVYVVRHQNHVSLCIVAGDAGVILVDPIGQLNLRVPALIKAAIGTVTDRPVRYVVYSHSSADHSTGGAAFADTAQFVGHRLTAERMSAANDSGVGVGVGERLPPPTVTFDRRLALELGGRTVDLYAADLWEADDYLILHDPAARLVMFVDLVQPKNVPFRRLLGHPDRIVERLRWLAETLDFDTLVSGHATPHMTGSKADVLEAAQYYLDLSEAIDQARASGQPDHSAEMRRSVRTALTARYGGWRRFDEMLDLNVEGMLRWRAGEQLGHYLGAPH